MMFYICRESLAQIEARISAERSKKKELERKRAEGEVRGGDCMAAGEGGGEGMAAGFFRFCQLSSQNQGCCCCHPLTLEKYNCPIFEDPWI
jgi:hypothetical protein